MFFTEQIHSYLYSNKNFEIDIFVFNWQQVHILKNNVNMTFNSIKHKVSK